MKILYLADLHLRTMKPLSRTDDDYFETQFDKLNQIKEIVIKEKVDLVILGGDVYDSNKVSYYLIVRTILFFKELTSIVPVYSVVGNHDMLGQNIDAMDKTVLGIMFSTDFIKKLDVYKKGNVYIKGIDYRLKPDTDYMIKEKDNVKIIASHDMITPTENFPFEVLPIDKIKTNAEIVLCSHYHVPFTVMKKKTLFINPGSLMRIKHITENVERIPQVVLLTITKQEVKHKLIKLKAKKGTSVFDVQAKKETIEDELKLDKFFESLISMNNTNEKFDIEQALHLLNKENKIDIKVFEEALNRIKSAKQIVE